MTNSEQTALILFGLTIGGLALWANSDDQKKASGLTRRRTRTRDLTPTREGLEINCRGKKEVKEFSPNFSATTVSTISRSSGIEPCSKSLTSRKTETSKIPEISDIRKYPSTYYSLNKKQQWKFRKQLENLHLRVQ